MKTRETQASFPTVHLTAAGRMCLGNSNSALRLGSSKWLFVPLGDLFREIGVVDITIDMAGGGGNFVRLGHRSLFPTLVNT